MYRNRNRAHAHDTETTSCTCVLFFPQSRVYLVHLTNPPKSSENRQQKINLFSRSQSSSPVTSASETSSQFCAALRKVQGRAKAANLRQDEIVRLLDAENVETDDTRVPSRMLPALNNLEQK